MSLALASILGAATRGTLSVQVHKWRRRKPTSALRQDLSALSVRLGFRCADLLCSEEPCNKQARATICVPANLPYSGEPAHVSIPHAWQAASLCAALLNASVAQPERLALCER